MELMAAPWPFVAMTVLLYHMQSTHRSTPPRTLEMLPPDMVAVALRHTLVNLMLRTVRFPGAWTRKWLFEALGRRMTREDREEASRMMWLRMV